jgi:hypothetical protein
MNEMLNGGVESNTLLMVGKKRYSAFFPDHEPNDATMPLPQLNDNRLTAFDKLNENVLSALISGHSQEKQLSMVNMSVEEITGHENAAKHLKECFDMSHPRFVQFEGKQDFWRQFKLHIEKRKSYISKLI